MSYNLITFSNCFHWVYTKNGCLVRAAIGVSVTMLLIIQENGEMFHWRICYDVANYTRKRRNVIKSRNFFAKNFLICIVKHEHINFKKKFSEILSFQDLILVTGGYWDNKDHYLVLFPPRGKQEVSKDLIRRFYFLSIIKTEFILVYSSIFVQDINHAYNSSCCYSLPIIDICPMKQRNPTIVCYTSIHIVNLAFS